VTTSDLELGRIYPALQDIREISVRVTTELVEHLYETKLATFFPEPVDKEHFVRSQLYSASGQNEI
jgi:malate dehydrogenase (oxaloacetate-decarboxylating)(NADP+)